MAELHLPSLEISNFKGFECLTIGDLGRVNLVTGKNNVGKTSLLEAIWLYTNGASSLSIRQMLQDRDELNMYLRQHLFGASLSETSTDYQRWLEVICSFFRGRPTSTVEAGSIKIGAIADDNLLQIRIALMAILDSNVDEAPRRLEIDEADRSKYNAVAPWISIKQGATTARVRAFNVADAENAFGEASRSILPSQFVRSGGVNEMDISVLWDAIQLTNLEWDVIDSLELIDSRIERISLRRIDAGQPTRSIPIVKLEGIESIVSLKSLGAGMTRIFGLTLALANSKRGILLVDEIENGLHYSVMADIWRLLLTVAEKLNVQVFATTHSWDCVTAFQQVLAESDAHDGKVIRLETDATNSIKATVFDERKLSIAAKRAIEIR